jgi:hypothetical protein
VVVKWSTSPKADWGRRNPLGAQNLAAGDFSMWIWRRLVRPATKRHHLLQLPTVHTNKQSKWVAGMCPTSYGDCETQEEMLTGFVL